MKIKEKSTEEKVIRKYLLRLRQPRIKKKENRYYIRGYKGTEVIIRTDHEILKRIAYRRTCVKQVCIPGRYETETKYIYTRKENRRSRPVIVPGIPTGRETAMPRAVRTVLHALSYGGIEVEASRKLADLKKMDPMRIFYRTLDAEVYNGDYKVPIRLFFPTEEDMENGAASGKKPPVILFFHGGGWVTESVENYQRVCARMAQSTGQIVASVEYRLAPEYRFPVGLMDCYAAAKTFYTNRFLLNTDPDRITIMGDSAGGNLAAALPSERAFAYKMKSEAMKRQGFRTDLTSSQVVTKLRTDDKVAQGFGVGRMTVQRFIRLTELIPPILQMVDEGKIALTPAVELSFLKKDEQENLFATMESEEATPSLSQAQRMKQLSQSGRLDMDTIFAIMTEEKGNQKETLKINTSKLKKYFPKNTTPKQMEETIIKLLERELQRKRNRDSR